MKVLTAKPPYFMWVVGQFTKEVPMETQVCTECQRVRRTDKNYIWLPWRKEQIPEDAECTVCESCEKTLKRLLERQH